MPRDVALASALELPAILDVEASGFGRHSYPIEVGYVLPDGSSWCSLIRPAPHWTHWDESAERLHHIGRDTLIAHGRSVRDVALALNDRLRGLTVFSDGWAHDYPWLGALYEEAGMAPTFRLDSLRRLLSEHEAQEWQATRLLMSERMAGQRHRASADARLLQATLGRLRSGPAQGRRAGPVA